MPEGSCWAAGAFGDVHGKVRGRPRGLELSLASKPVARRGEYVCRRLIVRAGQMLRHIPLVPRRLARPRTGPDGGLRADGEFVQALCRRFMGADAARLELRQSHCRVPGRRSWIIVADRVPDSRCRL